MLIDEVAELRNSNDALSNEIEKVHVSKKTDDQRCIKLEEKNRVLLAVIGRMDELQKSSQQQEKILSEMRGQLVDM